MDEYRLLNHNILDIPIDTKIYRIVRVQHLAQDIADGTLTLSRVIGWEDTYEAAFYRRAVRDEATNQSVGLYQLAVDWFGQCWTTLAESDALWRIYNHDGLSVRISTTCEELFRNAVKGRCHVAAEFTSRAWTSMWLGLVKYYSAEEFGTEMERHAATCLDSSGERLARELLKKRDAFIHEHEVRFLYLVQLAQGGLPRPSGDVDLLSRDAVAEFSIGDHQRDRLPRFIRFPFDWRCVTDVMAGPRSSADSERYIRILIAKFAPWMSVFRSRLYDAPHYSGTL